MYRSTISTSLVLSAALAGAACNRDRDKMTPATEVQSQSAQPANTPLTVAGCVKAGDADDTYVLTTARAEGAAEPATYQLVGSQTASLRDHVGRRVEVSGTMQAQQEVASRSTAQSTERPTGTIGKPTVQTRSEVDIKRLSVSSIRPLGDKCDD